MGNKSKRSREAFFLKALDGDFSKKLPIPPGFTENFNEEIPHWLIIEIAGTRKCWRVDIQDDGTGALHFTDGWDDFVQAHALEVGNTLLFQYKGQLILEVRIFDKDGFEKPIDQTSEFEIHEVEDSEYEPISGFEAYEVEDLEPQHGTFNTYHAEEASRVSARTPNAQVKQEQVVDRFKRKAVRLSTYENSMGFSIIWRETNHFYYHMTIPRAVVTKMKLSAKEEVVLNDQEGNKWPIGLRTRLDGRVDMTRGWKEFLTANKITAGNTLTFEFHSDNLIQVNIERHSQVDHTSQSAKECRSKPTGPLNVPSERVEPIANNNENYKTPEASTKVEGVCSEFRRSSFSITWKHSTSGGTYPHIPKSVAKEQNLQNNQALVLCDEVGKHWQQVAIRIRPDDGRFFLARGWSEFRRRNEIATGDTLDFEFVSDGMIKVSITRPSSQPHHSFEWVAVKQEAVAID